MIYIGLTGGIGSGKSTVAKEFEALGIPVFYSDEEAKKIMNTDLELKGQIISLLGPEVYQKECIHKSALAKIIFSDPVKRIQLEQLIHPAVRRAFEKWSKIQSAPYVVNESALIFEKNLQNHFDYIVLVSAPIDQRINRVVLRDGVDKAEVQKRVDAQMSDEEKSSLSNFTIINDDLSKLPLKILEIHNKILKNIRYK